MLDKNEMPSASMCSQNTELSLPFQFVVTIAIEDSESFILVRGHKIEVIGA